jgi:hypothetical protein
VLLELSISSYISDEFDIFLFKSYRFILTSSGKFSLRLSLSLSFFSTANGGFFVRLLCVQLYLY